jgi:hypothetical protein
MQRQIPEFDAKTILHFLIPHSNLFSLHNGTYKLTVKLEEGYTQSNFIIRSNDVVLNPVEDIYTIENITEDQYVTIEGLNLNQYQIEAKAYTGLMMCDGN